MDDKTMSELLAPIGELGASMAGMEVDDKEAAAALAEVLAGATEDDGLDEERERRELRAARSAARGKALEALRHAQLAAKLDAQQSDARTTVKYYDRAVADFAEALDGDGIPDAKGKQRTLEAMTAYLDRSRALRLGFDAPDATDAPDGDHQRSILLAMLKNGAAILARGVAARKAALDAATDWHRFLYFRDAADCFVAYLKGSNLPPPPAISQATASVLADLEALAPKLKPAS